jgi:hypothetical protein
METKESLFNPISKKDNAFLLASHFPHGKYFESVFNENTNLGKLIIALALEYYKIQTLTKKYADESDVTKTEDLLPAWEKSVGIPSDCIAIYGKNLLQRRAQVRGVLGRYEGVQTKEDFERVSLIFGFETEVTPGPGDHQMTATVTNIPVGIYFPLEFPIQFAGGGLPFLQCLLDSLAPANVEVIITTA